MGMSEALICTHAKARDLQLLPGHHTLAVVFSAGMCVLPRVCVFLFFQAWHFQKLLCDGVHVTIFFSYCLFTAPMYTIHVT